MHLADRAIRSLPSPAVSARITYDDDLPGFGIRITARDVRSFVLNYTVANRERRLTIGRFPTWSTTAAREEARRLKRLIDAGIDPLDQRAAEQQAQEAERQLPTVEGLFERYAEEHLPRKAQRSAADDRSMWKKLILPALGNFRVRDVSHHDIDRLHQQIGLTRPVRANRVVEVLRKAFNLAIRWGWRSDNPAVGGHKNHEERRTRYLTPAELLRLLEALRQHGEPVSADAIRLMLLTGSRRGEVLAARWDMFDLDQGIWVKPSSHTKQRREHRVPLSSPALKLLRELAAEAEGPFVFPSRNGGHLTDVKRTWLSVCKAAGLAEKAEVPVHGRRGAKTAPIETWRNTVRVHDLRHTFAAVLASQGLSLPIIGALLGHTQPQTTARYAHLLDDPLRAATEQAGRVLDRAGGS